MAFSSFGPLYLLTEESDWNIEKAEGLEKDSADGSQRSAEVRML